MSELPCTKHALNSLPYNNDIEIYKLRTIETICATRPAIVLRGFGVPCSDQCATLTLYTVNGLPSGCLVSRFWTEKLLISLMHYSQFTQKRSTVVAVFSTKNKIYLPLEIIHQYEITSLCMEKYWLAINTNEICNISNVHHYCFSLIQMKYEIVF